jgi:hypothetical protein
MDTIGIIELPGSTFLYALAFVAAAFVGFSSIVLVIRQTIGATLSRYQVLLARTDIELGFIVVGLSLLPMLISLFNLPHSLVLRGSSGIAALVLALWLAFFAYRFRKATPATLLISAWLHLAFALAVVIALAVNASGYLKEPQVGLYALALSYVLAEAVDTFLHSTNVMLRQSKDRPSRGEATPKQDV